MIRRYIEPPDAISDEALETLPPDDQREAMERWFRANFEDPAERMPYESAEGGYQWIWGGPYDAHEQLSDRFGGIVPDEVIESLAADLSDEMPDWAPKPETDEYEPPDDLFPPEIASEVRARYDALVAEHDRWLRYHPMRTGDEAEMRAEVVRRLDAAEEAVGVLVAFGSPQGAPPHGIGHNQPPERIETDQRASAVRILSPTQAAEITSAIAEAQSELHAPEPNLRVVEGTTSKLKATVLTIGLWLAKNVNLMTEEFSKAFGKTLGVTAASGLGLVGAIAAFGQLRAATAGLETWVISHLPF